MNGIDTTPRAMVVGVTVLVVGVAVLAGMAAAGNHAAEDDGWTVAFEGEVDAGEGGGEGGFTCTGMPTDHDCDKGGDMYAGPATVDYDGYNRGNFTGGHYEFEDRFVITDGNGSGVVVVVPCEFSDEPPEGNPCPATGGQYQDDGNGDDSGNAGGGPDENADENASSAGSDSAGGNGAENGNGNDDGNAGGSDEGGHDGGDGPVDADADVTVEPPSDGPLP